MAAREPIGVIGAGWVGLVTATCLAELGHEVWARDIVPEKVESLSRGEVPIHEPGLPELVAKNAARLHFTTDMGEVLEHARLLFVCVDTPPTYSGDADLSSVESVLGELGESNDHALVMKSTVPVGTGRSIQRRRPGTGYVSNPEFLKEGSAVADFMRPDRVVVGADDGSQEFAERVTALYAPLDAPVVSTDVASAEMIKLASNAFLATKISFINEIANVSEELGADVLEVARGMGLDDRIGSQFLRAGIGYGGSCLAGDETVLVRHHGRTTLLTFEQLWRRLEEDGEEQPEDGVVTPGNLEVLSFLPEQQEPIFLPVMCVTRRDYEGDLLEVRTKMGRRVRCTPDHPFLVTDADGTPLRRVLAEDLTEDDWLPIAMKRDEPADSAAMASILSAVEAAELSPERLIVRPAREEVAALVARPIEERREIFTRAASAAARTGDVKRTGAMRCDEACLGEVSVRGGHFGTARNGNFVRHEIELDEDFWRVVGLYIAEGCDNEQRKLIWSFHPDARGPSGRRGRGVLVAPRTVAAACISRPPSKKVALTSRLVDLVVGGCAWAWPQQLRAASSRPDLGPSRARQVGAAAGLFEGDGSWSLINQGPSVIIELGTVSDELADGVLRLLGELGIVASRRIGRMAKSTKDTHWIRISGADQVERAIELIPKRDRPGALASIARQTKRIAPTRFSPAGRGEHPRAHCRESGASRLAGRSSRSRFQARTRSLSVDP